MQNYVIESAALVDHLHLITQEPIRSLMGSSELFAQGTKENLYSSVVLTPTKCGSMGVLLPILTP